MKKVFSMSCVALFVAMVCFFSIPEECSAVMQLKLAHTRPMMSPLQKDLEVFAANVKKYSKGEIEIKIFGGGQLGGSEVVMERVGMGTIEMMAGWPNTSLDPKLEVYSLTGMCADYKDAKKVYKTGSPYMKIIHGLYKKQNSQIVAVYPTNFCGISFKNEPKDPLNPNAKHNDKIRVAPMNSFRYMLESVGYITSPLPWGEVFTALQTGIIDGVGAVGPEPTYLTLRDLVKYYLPVNLYMDVWFLTMNLEQYNDLSASNRAAIDKAAAEFEADRFKNAEKEQAIWENKLREAKVHVYKISDAQQLAFQKKLKDYCWPRIRKEVGAEFFDEVTKAVSDSLKK